MALDGVPTGIGMASSGSIPFLSNNVYGMATLFSIFGCVFSILIVIRGWQLYKKRGTLGDFSVWKE